MMTDEELINLLMAEGRAYLATLRHARRYDRGEILAAAFHEPASRLLGDWRAAQDALRNAVLDRLEAETAVTA